MDKKRQVLIREEAEERARISKEHYDAVKAAEKANRQDLTSADFEPIDADLDEIASKFGD